MNDFVAAITAGATAFSATNIDDFVILTLFFSQVNSTFRPQHIVLGQYLGFTALIITSLLGFFGSLVIPQPQIGLLGLVPIAIGLSSLLEQEGDTSTEVELETEQVASSIPVVSPQVFSVAAVTFANGGDNISIYTPLFASSNLIQLLVILIVFFLLVGVWCYITSKLTSQPAIADGLTRYGSSLVPFVLIGLGGFIVWESHTLESQALRILSVLIIYLYLMDLGRKDKQTPELEKN